MAVIFPLVNLERSELTTVSCFIFTSVKSLRPVPVSQTTFDECGLVGDRRLMVVRPSYSSNGGAATHRFLTQRQAPSLATIDASIPVEVESDRLEDIDDLIDEKNNEDDKDSTMTTMKSSKTRKTIIRLSHGEGPHRAHVHIDITPSTLKSLPISYRAGLWEDVVNVVDVGDAAASFVANIIKADAPNFGDARVVYVAGGRKINDRYCPDAARVGLLGSLPETGLTDGFPVSVLPFSTYLSLRVVKLIVAFFVFSSPVVFSFSFMCRFW